MTIDVELLTLLKSSTKKSQNRKRNTELIAHFYGFRRPDWPTLDDTATKFGIGSRERVRQIISKYFKSVADPREIPSAQKCAELIAEEQYWLETDLVAAINSRGLVDGNFSVRGLFNLMDDLSIDHGYEIYTPELERATRTSMEKFEERFVVNVRDQKRAKSILS